MELINFEIPMIIKNQTIFLTKIYVKAFMRRDYVLEKNFLK